MKIFCFTCREYILNTTESFILGGEYNGSMFEPAGRGKNWGNMFKQNSGVKKANLMCPRCECQFIRNGKLLTEHGVVQPGQKTIDTSFLIVAGEGHPLPGRLMFIKDSVCLDEVAESLETPTPDEVSEKIELVPGPDDETEHTNSESGMLKCLNCGKTYKPNAKQWYEKHVERCGK